MTLSVAIRKVPFFRERSPFSTVPTRLAAKAHHEMLNAVFHVVKVGGGAKGCQDEAHSGWHPLVWSWRRRLFPWWQEHREGRRTMRCALGSMRGARCKRLHEEQ